MTARLVLGLVLVGLLAFGVLVRWDPGPQDGAAVETVSGKREQPRGGEEQCATATDTVASGPVAIPVLPEQAVAEDATAADDDDPGRGRLSGRITGRLVDAFGQPVAGEPVDVLAGRDPWFGTRHRDAVHDVVDRGTSDAEGRFDLGARAGVGHTVYAGGRRRPRRRVTPVAAGADLEIELSRARTLTGTVLAEETGLPLPGVRVGAHSGDDRLFTHSDEEGRFTLGPVRDDLMVLTGFTRGYDVVITEPVAADWGPATLELPPGRELSGTIVHSQTHEPVPGARVTLRVMTETRPAGEADPFEGRRVVEDYVATSDEDGRYRVTGIPSRGFRVIVEAEGYLPSTSDRYFGRSPDFEQDVNIGLVPATDIAGLVQHDGRPVAGIAVLLKGDERLLATAPTDELGRFALPVGAWDGIAPVTVETGDDAGRFARRRLSADAMREDVVLSLVDPLVLEVEVRGGGGPLPGAQVIAASGDSVTTTQLTGLDGRARITHRVGGPDVDALWLQARHNGRASVAMRLSIPEELPDGPIVLDVDDGVWFGGTVQDVHGLPVAGAVVSVAMGRFTSSDRDGRFLLGPVPMEEDTTTAELTAAAEGHRTAEWADVFPARDLLLTLSPVVRWRGRATDVATGKPVESVQPRLQIERRDADTIAWEDVEGRKRRASGAPGEFSLELADPGRYRMVVFSRDHIATETPPILFDGVREPPVAEVSLAHAAVLTVRVADRTGTPVKGYQVWLVPVERAGERPTPAGVSGEGLRHQLTDRRGQTRFNLGTGGELRLASGPGAWQDGGPFLVAPGVSVQRSLVVPALGGLDVVVVDETQQPAAGLGVSLRSVGETRVHSIRRQGRLEQAHAVIEIRDVPAGDLELSLSHEEFEAVTRVVHVTGGRVTPVEVGLRRRLDGKRADG